MCHRKRVDLERLAEQDDLANILFNVYVYHVPCIIQDFLKTGYQWLCEGLECLADQDDLVNILFKQCISYKIFLKRDTRCFASPESSGIIKNIT